MNDVVDASSLEIVRDICSALNKDGHNERFGFFLDATSQNLRGSFPGTPGSTPSFNGDGELVLLEHLLPLRKTGTGHRGLTKKQRMVLAVTLASSVLQLHSTCFSHDWSKRAVSFIRRRPEQPDHAIAVDRPLLVRMFSTPERSSHAAIPTLAAAESKLTLLSLGALFLELHSGETLEDRTAGDASKFLGIDDRTKTLLVCQQWLAEEQEYMSVAWRQAINFALKSYVDLDTDLGEAVFRKAVHDEIVLPLEEDARVFVGSSAA